MKRALLFASAVFSCLLLGGCLTEFDRSRIGCGAAEACLPGVSCCERVRIEGGTFDRGYDASNDGAGVVGFQPAGAAPATVSSFEFERFEVTVERFRSFIARYDAWRGLGQPEVGAGAHPTAGASSGWLATYDTELPPDASRLEAELGCADSTFNGSGGALPANCVSWYLAFAYCISEGGRLPTEAEWNYVAAGGDQQRAFPWSEPPESVVGGPDFAVINDESDLSPVGSRSDLDAGRYGVHDLAGNVREWVLDRAPGDLSDYPSPCVDCVAGGVGGERIRRGGDYAAPTTRARGAYRSSADPSSTSSYIGVRCVYDL